MARPAPTPALRAAQAAGIPFTLHELPAHTTDSGAEAATALGSAGRIFKTLIVSLDGARLIVAIAPVTREVDLRALAALAQGARARLADPARAERATGYVLGSISPLGQRRRLQSYLDACALDFATIYVSAGRRGLELELAPRDLARVCGAELGRFSR